MKRKIFGGPYHGDPVSWGEKSKVSDLEGCEDSWIRNRPIFEDVKYGITYLYMLSWDHKSWTLLQHT